MSKKIFCLLLLQCVCFFSSLSFADTSSDRYKNPFYIGLTGGYGSTTWQGLVPPKSKQGIAMLVSTPNNVDEGGNIYGAFAGYEIIPCFAVEASYTRYPDATISFAPMSIVAIVDGVSQFVSHTETYAVMAKFMLFIPHTNIRVFSAAGPAEVHRFDQLADIWRLSPAFSVGLNYDFNAHIMGEIGFSYTGGYGESELNPADDYVPFLYSGFIHLAYRF